MEKVVYSVTEVAELLGISKSYVYKLIRNKTIPFLKLGKRKIIPKTVFEEWLKENVVKVKKSL